jgi:hypothetical protein
MKKILMIFGITLTLVTCTHMESNKNNVVHTYECSLPSEIPDTLATGEKIDWDCNWNSAYNSGRVKLVWNADGTLYYLYKTQ